VHIKRRLPVKEAVIIIAKKAYEVLIFEFSIIYK